MILQDNFLVQLWKYCRPSSGHFADAGLTRKNEFEKNENLYQCIIIKTSNSNLEVSPTNIYL